MSALGQKSGHSVMLAAYPLYPQKRTSPQRKHQLGLEVEGASTFIRRHRTADILEVERNHRFDRQEPSVNAADTDLRLTGQRL